MDTLAVQHPGARHVVHWIARILAVVAIAPLVLIAIGEAGHGPAGAREWLYLALFPVGFSLGYLLGWWRPRLGGWIALGCLAASLLVAGRVFPLDAYLIWAALAIPGVLYLLAGAGVRRGDDPARAAVSGGVTGP